MSQFGKTKLTRRELLVMGGAAVALAHVPGRIARAADATKAGMALQLYTMREPAKNDLAGTLKKCREIGWEYVQWSGMPDMPAEKIREALDAAGLKAMAAHTGVEGFETDFEGQLKFWKTVGVQAVGPGGMMGDCKDTLEAWRAGAKRLEAVGKKLSAEGIRLTYHNHSGEFEKFPEDDRCKLDILFEETDPASLFAELDLAWVYVGLADPAAYIRKYAKRCPTIHAKDLDQKKRGGRFKFMPLGKGVLNWDEIFVAGKEAGVEWYIYEQDSCEGDVFDAVKTSYDFLKTRLA